MPDLGAKRVKYRKPDGRVAELNFRMAEVTKPLVSVKGIVDRGNRVVFEKKGSYIENEHSGEKVELIQTNGVYVLEIPASSIMGRNESKEGFARQGR